MGRMPRACALGNRSFLRFDRGRGHGKDRPFSPVLPGHHVVWWSLEQKEKGVKHGTSAAWTAEEDERPEGVKFVNNFTPEDGSEISSTWKGE